MELKKFSRINLRKGHGRNHGKKSHLKQQAGHFCQQESILIKCTILRVCDTENVLYYLCFKRTSCCFSLKGLKNQFSGEFLWVFQ